MELEPALQALTCSLKTTLLHLREGANGASLKAGLHDTENQKLSDGRLWQLASEALDLLDEVRLLLEPGQLILADHFMGYYMSTKALSAAVELNVPDILRSGPKTLPDLAATCHARPERLRQVMRALRNSGIFAYDAETDAYRNNHVSTLLRSDHWTQWRNWVDMCGTEYYDMARGIPAGCRSDAVRSPAQINFDTDDSMFKYFFDRGLVPKLHKTLGSAATAQAPGILADYPWDEVARRGNKVVDVGGGGGALVALLLRRHESMKGAIFEAPAAIEQARANFHSPEGMYADVGDRILPQDLIVGDFFGPGEIPPNDVYTMKWCLHDWDDEKACVILKNIRAAIRKSPLSRLVVMESVLSDGHTKRISRYCDLNMMVAVGGKERDEEAFRWLATEAGWTLRKIYPLRNTWVCAIEFVPVWTAEEEEAAEKQQLKQSELSLSPSSSRSR